MTSNARLSADIGGTFTDVVLEADGRRHTRKVLTTHRRPELAVLEGAEAVLADAGVAFRDVEVFVHGTTLATNAVLERRGSRTALVATAGFRDVLEIGSESRHDQYDLFVEKRPPLVPRSLRFTVPERLLASGEVRLPLDVTALKAVAAQIRRGEAESVAVCFLHSYANPAHEHAAREVLQRELPGVPMSLSCEVCPEIREYERTSTTVANAYVQPLIEGYLQRMRSAMRDRGFGGSTLLVTSSGALTSVETAQRFPVRLIESGPAGGAIFATEVARRAGVSRALAFDMGGTTAKVCLIDDFQPDGERSFEVDRAARFRKGSGLPLRIPVIDLVEIGAGGGSIASVDALGKVRVGPESAGSEPGPACYGLGGALPTVTDADTVLGIVDPGTFAGGSVNLDTRAAEVALERSLARPLDMSVEMSAYAVHEIVCESMASAARVHAVEKGKSIADYTMIAFGGAAPLHAARVAEKLGVKTVIVPADAGVGSAVGFLRAPVAYEVVRSHHALLADMNEEAVNRLLGGMWEEANGLVGSASSGAAITQARYAYMRYVGQGHEVAVALPSRTLRAEDRPALRHAFEELYATLFHRKIPGAAVEILSWSVLAMAHQQRHDAGIVQQGVQAYDAEPHGSRRYFDGRSGSSQDIPLYVRPRLSPGAQLDGPAVIAEPATTTFVGSGFGAQVDPHGNLVLTRRTERDPA
jgi:N-methylhydantoinase A